MVRYEDQCVGCPPEMGCIGNICRYKNVPVWVCDRCKDEEIDLWDYDGEEVCESCLKKIVPKVHREGYPCDSCGYEAEDLYDYEDQYVCEDCLLDVVYKIHHE